MTTYINETIPQSEDELPLRFEVQQGMNDPKLTEQPGTGRPVRRLISGGFAIFKGKVESIGSVTDPSYYERD
ncbi:hypothetical protein N9733_08505 [Akkermansiaceae bacterium]|nr:hypothetical protein [Akkermansiaceae bacterium]